MKKRVLVLCTGNSCRSQMAQGWFERLGDGDWQAESAGSNPAGYVHPLAVRAMKEVGIDLSAHTSKHVDQFAAEPFDLVVTVCDSARDVCPAFAGATETLHWPFADPAHATGSEEEKMQMFRDVRDQIRDRIASWLASAPR